MPVVGEEDVRRAVDAWKTWPVFHSPSNLCSLLLAARLASQTTSIVGKERGGFDNMMMSEPVLHLYLSEPRSMASGW